MQLTLSKNALISALVRCAPGADTGRPQAHAGLVKLVADGARLSLTTTNLSLLVQDSVPATIKKSGSLTVVHRKLLALVSALGGEDVSLAYDKNFTLKLTSGSQRKAQLQGAPGNDFPSLPQLPESRQSVPVEALHSVVSRVEHAIGDTDRAFLDGVRIEADGSWLSGVAMCASRIAHAKWQLRTRVGPWFVPRYALKSLHEAAGDKAEDAQVEIGTTDNAIFFWGNGLMVAAMLPAGDFPDWRRLVESMPKSPVGSVNPSFVAESTKAVLALDANADIDLAFDAADKTLKLVAKDTESDNNAEDVLPYEPSEHDSCATKVQGKFLRDAMLAANENCEVLFAVVSQKPEDPAALVVRTQSYFSLVMPVVR